MDAILAVGLIAFWTVVFLLVAVCAFIASVAVYVIRAVLNADRVPGPDLLN